MDFKDGKDEPRPAEKKCEATYGGDDPKPFYTGQCQYIKTSREKQNPN